MNMLNPEFKALCSFTKEEQTVFCRLIHSKQLEIIDINGKWMDSESLSIYQSGIYRLKLKEGDNYYLNCNNYSGNHECICEFINGEDVLRFRKLDGSDYVIKIKRDGNIHDIHIPTQEEIDSVKPEFKRGDVVYNNINTGTTMRLGCSIILYDGVSFGDNIGSKAKQENFSKATPDQIKQLELEEMKHGKKWNGEGYDDWLTADGLTLDELLEHDIYKIQCSTVNGDGTWQNSNYHDKLELIDTILSQCTIGSYRLKPKETFVDVEIEWPDGSIAFSEWGNGDVTSSPIGQIWNGWVLSGYVMADGYHTDKPIKFQENGTVINEKAHSVRFVKVGE